MKFVRLGVNWGGGKGRRGGDVKSYKWVLGGKKKPTLLEVAISG